MFFSRNLCIIFDWNLRRMQLQGPSQTAKAYIWWYYIILLPLYILWCQFDTLVIGPCELCLLCSKSQISVGENTFRRFCKKAISQLCAEPIWHVRLQSIRGGAPRQENKCSNANPNLIWGFPFALLITRCPQGWLCSFHFLLVASHRTAIGTISYASH